MSVGHERQTPFDMLYATSKVNVSSINIYNYSYSIAMKEDIRIWSFWNTMIRAQISNSDYRLRGKIKQYSVSNR